MLDRMAFRVRKIDQFEHFIFDVILFGPRVECPKMYVAVVVDV